MSEPIELVLAQVRDPTGHAPQWTAFCPAHEDRNARSLSISENDDGSVLVHCHRGCEPAAIVAAIGLQLRDLFPHGDTPPSPSARKDRTVTDDDLAALNDYITASRRRLQGDTDIARRARAYAGRFGLSEDDAVELGLGVDPGSSITERPGFLRQFNGPPRLIVPFCRPDGTVAGCQGRALATVDDGRTKRWESPAGKGWARIGYYALGAPDPVIVTEGPGDALTAVGAGYAAAAVRGASLYGPATADELAADLGGRILLVAGDADDAGTKFSDRLSINLRARGLRTIVLGDIPNGDLTGWREQAGPQFAEQLEQAVNTADIVDPPTPPDEPEPDGGEDAGQPGARRNTDAGNALRLVDHHRDDIRYVGEWSRWLVWDGTRWERDANLSIVERAKAVANRLHIDAALTPDPDQRKAARKFAKDTESVNRLRAMVDLARSDPRIATRIELLDLDQWLLNVPNGTVDLRTGQLQPHRHEDFITKLAPVAYHHDAECPLWMAFLTRIMDGDAELIGFLQRAVGYSLTGSVREQCLFIPYGSGANGKTTFVTTIMNMLGVDEYALKTPKETLVARREGSIPNDLARLRGARFVYASETEAGARLAESMVKDLTGGDVISARFMRGEWFDFTPVSKVWLATNHRPVIRGTDEAIWRRIRLIPFTVTIPEPERDKELETKLAAELPGILAWAVRGCLDWQRDGLGVPEEVAQATAGYRGEMDVIGQFINDRFVASDGSRVQSKALYDAYREWCDEAGEYVLSQRALGDRLREKGFESFRSGGKWWRGLGLIDDRAEQPTLTEGSERFQSAADDANAPAENGTLEPSGTFPQVRPHANARAHASTRTHAHGAVMPEEGSERFQGSNGAEPAVEEGEWEF